MAQISGFTRDTLIGIHLTLFNAVPGAGRLAWMIQQYDSGMSQIQITDALASTYAEEFAVVAPPQNGLAVGTLVAERLLGVFGTIVPVDAWLWARQWAWDQFDAGASYPEVLVEAVNALRATTNSNYIHAQALLENRITLAKHVALALQQDPVNLLEAQNLVAFVDHQPDSVDTAKQYVAARHQEGSGLSPGMDTLTATVFNAFPEYGPGTNSYANTLQTGDVLTGSGAAATLNAALTGALPQMSPVLQGIAVINLWVTGDQLLIMDLQHASGLRKLTINSNVRVDLHGLRTDGQADGRQLEIDARGVAGELLLFVDAPFDTGQPNSVPHDALRDLAIVAGDGATNILIRGVLAGSIEGGRGGATIDVGIPGTSRDMLGISSIHNAVGTATVTANDMLATASDKGLAGNSGFDDVKAAVISVMGGGIYVQNLLSSQDWDGASRFKWIGASIDITGDGADQVNFVSMADGTSIATGAGDDTVRVMNLGNQSVLGADSDGDGAGAVLDLGAGEDGVSFSALESRETTNTVIVGRGALVQGAERVIVEALDRVSLVALSSAADTKPAFVGTRILELEIENQTLAPQGEYYNDNDESDGSIEADLARFDTALELVMMTSHELVETSFDGAGAQYRAGAPTAFKLHNVQLPTGLILDAWDVTSHLVTPAGVLINDTLLAIDRETAVVTTNIAARDHSLWLSHAGARGLNDTSSLSVYKELDLDLTLAPTSTDTVGAAASAADDDSMMIEHFTVNLGSGTSSIDFNGFGDVAHRVSQFPVLAADISSPVATSLAVNGVGSSEAVFIEGLNADTIILNGGVSTHDNEGAMVLQVDASNNYRIQTIAGDDILDLRADTVRADDGESAVDRADYIEVGRGFDTLIVNGDNHLGSNNLQRTAKATAFDDNLFTTLAGVEEIVVDTNHGSTGATQMFTLDDAAANKGLERLRFIGSDTQTLHMVIGENYAYHTPGNAVQTLHVDATAHQGDFNLVLDSNARPSDGKNFNLALDLRAAGATAVSGDNVVILDSGDEAQLLDMTLATASRNVDTRLFEGTASDVGHVALTVARGSIDSITLIDGGAENAAGVETTSDTYLISSAWTQDNRQFRFDASAIADTDNNTTTGGLVISAELSDAIRNTLLGSQNQDRLAGGKGADMITGGGGNDVLQGHAGDDTLVGDTGNDRAIFSANRENYDMANIDPTTRLVTATAGTDGQDLLLNVERLSFNDTSIAFDLDGNAGIVAKTIGAVFGAALVADKGLVGIGLGFADQGLSYEALMTMAIGARLQQDTSAERVVELLYTNVVGVPPDNAAKARYVALLEEGTYTIGQLGIFAAEQDVNINRIGLVGLTQTGLEFLPQDMQV